MQSQASLCCLPKVNSALVCKAMAQFTESRSFLVGSSLSCYLSKREGNITYNTFELWQPFNLYREACTSERVP